MGVAPMRFPDRQSETIGSHRSENQANMIGHETVCPDLDPGFARLLSQQVSIDLLVTVLEEDRLPTIPTLRNVVRKARDHEPRMVTQPYAPIVPCGKLAQMTEAGICIMSPYLPCIMSPYLPVPFE